MKKLTYIFFITTLFYCQMTMDAQTKRDAQQRQASLDSLVTRMHKLLDAVDQGCCFIYGLWEPFPKAFSLTRDHPYLSIIGAGGWAYLYKKEKKAAYISLAVAYATLYYRIQKNRQYGLAARYKLRRREALAMPLADEEL
jgi:hypothetical protein